MSALAPDAFDEQRLTTTRRSRRAIPTAHREPGDARSRRWSSTPASEPRLRGSARRFRAEPATDESDDQRGRVLAVVRSTAARDGPSRLPRRPGAVERLPPASARARTALPRSHGRRSSSSPRRWDADQPARAASPSDTGTRQVDAAGARRSSALRYQAPMCSLVVRSARIPAAATDGAGALARELGTAPGRRSPAGQFLRQAWPLTLREQGPLLDISIDAITLTAHGEMRRRPESPSALSRLRLLRFGKAALATMLALDSPGDREYPRLCRLRQQLVPDGRCPCSCSACAAAHAAFDASPAPVAEAARESRLGAMVARRELAVSDRVTAA